MKLEIGDIVEFKKYEDMSLHDNALICEEDFPEYGKVTDVRTFNTGAVYFNIEGSLYNFNSGSVARIISDVDDVDINKLNVGDEVLMKVTIGEIKGEHIWVSWVDKSDVIKVLKRKEPERFIVKEDYYGMYVNGSEVLVVNKDDAKIFDSRNEANNVAADMHLNAWDVIPYDD